MNRHALRISLMVAMFSMATWSRALLAAPLDQLPTAPSYSAPALYNLGNSYARAGEPALAVLSYERARLLAPMDPDIRANLSHVRESAGLPTNPDRWWSPHDRLADANTMYWIGLLGLALAGAGFLLRRLRADHRTALTAMAIAGLVLTTWSLCDAIATASVLNESVVMRTAPASASPISGAEPLFTVPQAEVVTVRDAHQGFWLIRDSRGREGWVARSDLTPIIPNHESSLGTPLT